MSKHCLNSHFRNNYYRFKTFIMLSLEPGKGYSSVTSGQKQEHIIRNQHTGYPRDSWGANRGPLALKKGYKNEIGNRGP